MRKGIQVGLLAIVVTSLAMAVPNLGATFAAELSSPLVACAGFSDVSDSDHFCLALTVMVSQGDVGGYADGTFRPNNFATRGQFSKILVNHFDWSIITPPSPSFNDVPRESPFYSFIETAYARGIMSGYACGGTGEPCPGAYFRPDHNVTRGQMAKMVANAANFNDSTVGRTPSYNDVPDYDPFFTYIERVVMHAVNSIYPPNAPLPYCASQPCFFPHSDAPRADIVMHIFGARNTNYYGQSFATKQGVYSGVDVRVTFPNNYVPPGRWTAAPVAATNRWNGRFVESGPTEDCYSFCDNALHPYGSWGNWYSGREEIYRNLILASNSPYQYRSEHFGGTGGQWQSQFCSGAGCAGMITSQDIGSTLPYVAAAVESNYIGQGVGTINVTNPYALAGGYWNPWCYDPTLQPWKTAHPPLGLNGNITPCSLYSWTISY